MLPRKKSTAQIVMRELERVVLLKVVDTKWMAHIDDMDELKKGIGSACLWSAEPGCRISV